MALVGAMGSATAQSSTGAAASPTDTVVVTAERRASSVQKTALQRRASGASRR